MSRFTPRDNQIVALCVVTLWLAGITGPLSAEEKANDYTVITGDLPPYSYIEDNVKKGFAYEIVLSIIKKLGNSAEIKSEVWTRVVQESANVHRIIFPLVRLPYREGKYQWIGPIISDRLVFLARAEDNRSFSRLEDFRFLKIGALRGTPSETILSTLKFPYLETSPYNSYAIKKLILGRLDAFFDLELETRAQMRLEGLPAASVKIVFVYQDVRIYIGASPDIDRGVVLAWQRALDQLKAGGQYAAILERYGLASYAIR